MKFSVAAILGVVATLVNAKASITNLAFDIKAGQPFTLKWANATGPVNVDLVNGPSGNLKLVTSLATGVSDSSYTWTPPSSLATDTYAFRVTDQSGTGEPNYSQQFQFAGSAAVTTTATQTSTGASTTQTATVTSTTTTSAVSSSSSSSSPATTVTTVVTTGNSTTATGTTKTSSTTTSATKSASTTVPANTNNGQRFASPLALVLVTVAALVCFN